MTAVQNKEPNTGNEPFKFAYEDKKTVEGRRALRTDSHDLAALRFSRCLEALEGPTSRLLEIGGGPGRYLRAFQHYRPHLELHGCDISHITLEEAEKAKPNGSIYYKLGDALQLPYADNNFDRGHVLGEFDNVTAGGKAARGGG